MMGGVDVMTSVLILSYPEAIITARLCVCLSVYPSDNFWTAWPNF